MLGSPEMNLMHLRIFMKNNISYFAALVVVLCALVPLAFSQAAGQQRSKKLPPQMQSAAAAAPGSASERSDKDKEDYCKAMEDADQKIDAEVKAHSELVKNLEYLSTQIGPRLTGSPQMQAASDWTLK